MGEIVKYRLLSQEDLETVAKVAGREVLKVIRNERKKELKKNERGKIRRTKHMLKSYRRMKASLDEEVEFTEEEKIELRWKFVEDLLDRSVPNEIVDKSEQIVVASETKRRENLYAIQCIDNAIKLYGDECSRSSNEEVKRRFRELYAMYIAPEQKSVIEIADEEGVSEKTVYRDIDIVCEILSVYLLGI